MPRPYWTAPDHRAIGVRPRTVSLGGTTFREAADSADSLVAEADRALYEAKEAGRDRLVLA